VGWVAPGPRRPPRRRPGRRRHRPVEPAARTALSSKPGTRPDAPAAGQAAPASILGWRTRPPWRGRPGAPGLRRL